ncbi:hypothetical protein Syun_003023 [Stephania yunnanensis]|uniref:non-specific serine/threonine protein kinase n=1 Tax=Stephania yunnanensis TaxID=152371 RepID=A0AAP0L0M0_9MAGN
MGRYGVSSYSFCLVWLFFIHIVLSELPENQINTMIRLSKLVGSNSWSNTSGSSSPCSWRGVTCTQVNRTYTLITQLSLPGLGVSDPEFLTVLCQIDSLQSLDLSYNQLTTITDEFITDCGKISTLKKLNFSWNKLSGLLPIFHGFVVLESLDLSYNSLEGSVESQLDGLVGIRSLNLSQNKFTGFLPSKLGKNLALEELQFSKNYFTGPIPEELIRSYQNLTLIDLSVNGLNGSIPNTIGRLSKLKTLLISSNALSGAIPEGLSSIQTLSWLSANQNRFTGRIPRGISRYLTSLDLSYNQLNGLIPDDLLSAPNLQHVDLSYNSLQGPIGADMSPSLFRLRLGSNLLNGSIPSAALGRLLKMTYLELDNNSLSGDIPIELGKCKSLALLNLAQNKLSGFIPKELGTLEQLQVIKLQQNRLNGEIPVQFSQLSSLLNLNISGNSLTGSIPSAIGSLKKVTNINLQGNKLTGAIPDLTGNSELIELQLGTNCLSGKIPDMPLKLQIALNLSHNCFEGPIPATLGKLSALEVLDLSNNRFTGTIPRSLTGMVSLTELVVSNNRLQGTVPEFNNPHLHIEFSGNDLKNATDRSPDYTSKRKKISVTAAVLISIAAAVFAIVIVGMILFLGLRRLYQVEDENVRGGEEAATPEVIQGHIITTNSFHKSRINFNIATKAVTDPRNIILKSRFSTYYKADMPGDDSSYYIKKLSWSDKVFQQGSHEKFGQEIETLGRMSNSSVMIPLAYFLTADSAYLFYEYAEKGTLFDALHGIGSSASFLDWPSRFNAAVRIAEGLAFLHGCTSGPVHLFDLSSKNIFMKSLKEPKIGDIELCKVIDPSKSTGSLSAVSGSVGYIPPEYAYTMRVTMAGNVYSFGVILLELLTGKRAVSEGTELAKWVLGNSTNSEARDHILDPNISKASSGIRNQMISVLKIALGCIAVSPVARPKMSTVLKMLLNAR